MGLSNIVGAEVTVRVFKLPSDYYLPEPIMADYLFTKANLPTSTPNMNGYDPADIELTSRLPGLWAQRNESGEYLLREGVWYRLFVSVRVILNDGRKSLWSDEAKWSIRWITPS